MPGTSSLRKNKILDGQLFRAAGGMVWEYAVEAPTQAPEPHAKLLRRGDARTIKIISMSALLDRGLFEPVG